MLPIPWAHGTASAQRGPFSNVTKAPQRPTKVPCMSPSWRGEERQASKVASALSGADRDSSFLVPRWPLYAPPHSDWSVGTPPSPAEALHGRMRRNFFQELKVGWTKKRRKALRVWIRRQTATSVSGIQITAASALYIERPFGGDHPSVRSPQPRAFLSYK